MKNFNDVYGPGSDNYGRDKVPLIEMENCVSCGEETRVPKILNTDARAFYVEGAGQLCESCYNKVYGPRMTKP